MAAASPRIWRWIAEKPFAHWVLLGGLGYYGLANIISILLSVTAGIVAPIYGPIAALAALSVLVGALTLLGRQWAYALAAALGLFFLLVNLTFLAPRLINPADQFFWISISGVPILFLVVIFSVLALMNAREGIARKKYLASPRSTGGLLAAAAVGFAVGGLIVGNFAATTISGILASGGADIRIVPNAAATSTPAPFSPATFTVAAGATVSWFNGDNMQHSVTSDAGLFDSGLLSPGARWSYTFTQPGTYAYHCTPHPWMKGTILVR